MNRWLLASIGLFFFGCDAINPLGKTGPNPDYVACMTDLQSPGCKRYCAEWGENPICPQDAGADGSVDGSDGGPTGCLDATSCTHPDAPRCEAGDCVACASGADCERFVASPVCGPEGNCVECTDSAQEACMSAGKVCKAGDTRCVDCNEQSDCRDPAASVCSEHACAGCQADDDCSHLSDTPVCDTAARACVACLPGKTTACGANVCDVVGGEGACSSLARASADVCQTCVSDEQCKTGQVCVAMRWDTDGDDVQETEVGWFCQWVQGGGGGAPAFCNSSARPYQGERSTVTADQSEELTVCTLRATTCPAIASHSDACGRFGSGSDAILVEDVGDPRLPPGTTGAEIMADASVCGLAGQCVARNTGNGAYRCSVTCLNSSGDCPAGPITCGGTPPGVAGVCGI